MGPPAQPIALLAPMRPELRPLLRPLALRREGAGADALYRGAAVGTEVVAVIGGIGPGSAARATERLLDAARPRHVVVVGIAGGIGPSVAIGDLVVPAGVVDLETGAEYRPAPFGAVEPRGLLATSDGLIVDPERFRGMGRQGFVAVDMETSAVAAVCERRGCPWSVFRGISDRADDGSVDDAVFGLAGPDGAGDPRAVLRFVLTRPWRLPQLARLGLDMRRAAARAASAAIEAIRKTA
jgi:adenosylhomocysteine nucleosidase